MPAGPARDWREAEVGLAAMKLRLAATVCAVLLLFLGFGATRCARREPGTLRVFGFCVGAGAQGGN